MPDTLIARGLLARRRRAAVAAGDTNAVAEIDKKLAPPVSPVVVATDAKRKRLVGNGYTAMDGPEMAALRARMDAAASGEAAKPASANQKIANGLKARKNASRHDESFIPDWSAQGGLRRT